jgi:predicted nucleic acid-binding Zn ribbon protein
VRTIPVYEMHCEECSVTEEVLTKKVDENFTMKHDCGHLMTKKISEVTGIVKGSGTSRWEKLVESRYSGMRGVEGRITDTPEGMAMAKDKMEKINEMTRKYAEKKKSVS